jgi:hypothetical protein
MKMEKGALVIVKSFLGKKYSKKYKNTQDDYWKLIGRKGRIIEVDNVNKKILVLFLNDLEEYEIKNHNPIKNSLWIDKNDLVVDSLYVMEKRLDRKINNLTKYMNNTKWYKLFTELEKQNIQIIRIKLFYGDNAKILYFNGKYNKNGFKDMDGGPFSYKHIEWITVSRENEIKEWKNGKEEINIQCNDIEINEIKIVIDKLGTFEYENTENEIKIYLR